MSEITAKITKDFNQFPTQIDFTLRQRKYKVAFTRDEINIPRNFPHELYDILHLIYPFSEKVTEIFSEGELVYSSVAVNGAPTTTVMYTVPAHKRLYILGASLNTSNNGAGAGAAIWGSIYVIDPSSVADPPDIIIHHWLYANTEVRTDVSGPINYGFPSSFRVEAYTAANNHMDATFFGVLKDE